MSGVSKMHVVVVIVVFWFKIFIPFVESSVAGDPCSCNLHLGECDVNCCCDSECSITQKMLFSDCIVTKNDPMNFCWTPSRDNRFLPTGKTSSEHYSLKLSPGCIYNYNESRFSFSDEVSFSEEGFISGYRSALLSKTPEHRSTDHYMAGTPVEVEYVDGTHEYLWFEANFLDLSCSTIVPIEFLKPIHSKCSKTVSRNPSVDNSDSLVSCDQLAGVPGLISSAGTNGQFFVHSLPAFTNGTARRNTTTPIIRCWDAQTLKNITCPNNPPGVGTDDVWCTSVPIRVKYTFHYDVTGKILSLHVDAALGNVSQTYIQETLVDFLQVGESLNAPASGNPGYRIGSPIVAARANLTDLASLGKQGSIDSVLLMDLTNTAESVLHSISRTHRYTGGLWNLPAGGPCIPELDMNSIVDYEPLRFGQDTFTGCTINLSTADFQDPVSGITDWAARCDFYQTRLWHALNYPTSTLPFSGSFRFVSLQPEYVASWPAARTNQSGDWVPIQNPLLSTGLVKPNGRTGLCTRPLVTGS
ncbi:hypothetical protein FGIG_02791 [Fasciola gigantica]|uniref:Tectonic-1-3 N-terminal domain-containing protein n=1 Tax=Fasciola gigantica TaxID=46835 RepID=A0A504WV06_FASGI|nr:hypothetical protein FGIG_02791 [Fasciola gigantica]